MRIGEQNESQPIAMIGRISHHQAIEHPCIAACLRIAMSSTQETQAVMHGFQVLRTPELAPRHCIVEYEARAAHEMSRTAVVHRTVVFEEMVEAAMRIDRPRMVERHRAVDVLQQKLATAKIGLHGFRCADVGY